ncbi:MAG: hypothetical protein SGPRY_000751 [Prymnesium sp.]
MTKEMVQLEQARTALAKQKAELEQALTAAKDGAAGVPKMQADLGQAQAALKAKEDEVLALQKHVASGRDELNMLRKQAAASMEQQKKDVAQAANEQFEKVQLPCLLARHELEGRLKAEAQAFAGFKAQADAQRQALEAESAAARRAAEEAAAREHTAAVSQRAAEEAAAAAAAAAAKQQSEAEAVAKARHAGEVAELRAKIKRLEANPGGEALDTARAETEAAKKEGMRLQDALSRAIADAQAKKYAVEQLSSEMEKTKAALSAQTQNAANNESGGMKTDGLRVEVQKKFQQQEEELAKRNKYIQDATSRLARLEDERRKLVIEASDARKVGEEAKLKSAAERSRMTAEISKLQSELARLTSEGEELRSELSSKRAEAKQLSSELEAEQRAHAETGGALGRAEALRDELRGELRTLRTQREADARRLSDVESNEAQAVEQALSLAREEHVAALTAREEEHKAQMEQIVAAERGEREERLRQQHAAAEQSAAAELAALREEESGARQRLEAEWASKLAASQEQLRAEAERALEEARAAQETALEEMREALLEEKLSACAETKAHCDAVMATLNSDVERLRGTLCEREEALRASQELSQELEASAARGKSTISELEQTLKAERVEMAARLSGREAELQAAAEGEREKMRASHMSHTQELEEAAHEVQGRLQGEIKNLNEQMRTLQERFDHRESREEDLAKLDAMAKVVQQRDALVQRAKEEMHYYKLELQNREENYNQLFSKNLRVGVMNPIPNKAPPELGKKQRSMSSVPAPSLPKLTHASSAGVSSSAAATAVHNLEREMATGGGSTGTSRGSSAGSSNQLGEGCETRVIPSAPTVGWTSGSSGRRWLSSG